MDRGHLTERVIRAARGGRRARLLGLLHGMGADASVRVRGLVAGGAR